MRTGSSRQGGQLQLDGGALCMWLGFLRGLTSDVSAVEVWYLSALPAEGRHAAHGQVIVDVRFYGAGEW
jgi:hypothetical protein